MHILLCVDSERKRLVAEARERAKQRSLLGCEVVCMIVSTSIGKTVDMRGSGCMKRIEKFLRRTKMV